MICEELHNVCIPVILSLLYLSVLVHKNSIVLLQGAFGHASPRSFYLTRYYKSSILS